MRTIYTECLRAYRILRHVLYHSAAKSEKETCQLAAGSWSCVVTMMPCPTSSAVNLSYIHAIKYAYLDFLNISCATNNLHSKLSQLFCNCITNTWWSTSYKCNTATPTASHLVLWKCSGKPDSTFFTCAHVLAPAFSGDWLRLHWCYAVWPTYRTYPQHLCSTTECCTVLEGRKELEDYFRSPR